MKGFPKRAVRTKFNFFVFITAPYIVLASYNGRIPVFIILELYNEHF